MSVISCGTLGIIIVSASWGWGAMGGSWALFPAWCLDEAARHFALEGSVPIRGSGASMIMSGVKKSCLLGARMAIVVIGRSKPKAEHTRRVCGGRPAVRYGTPCTESVFSYHEQTSGCSCGCTSPRFLPLFSTTDTLRSRNGINSWRQSRHPSSFPGFLEDW